MKEINENTPWYKQWMVWMVIAPPFAAVVAGVITINLAIVSDDGLVVDDYYKQGLGINQTIQRDKLAWSMNLKSKVNIENGKLLVTINDETITSDLIFKFVHPTQSDRDISLHLSRVSAGSFDAVLPHKISGNWNVLLEPVDKKWRLLGRAKLPLQGDLSLAHGYTPDK